MKIFWFSWLKWKPLAKFWTLNNAIHLTSSSVYLTTFIAPSNPFNICWISVILNPRLFFSYGWSHCVYYFTSKCCWIDIFLYKEPPHHHRKFIKFMWLVIVERLKWCLDIDRNEISFNIWLIYCNTSSSQFLWVEFPNGHNSRILFKNILKYCREWSSYLFASTESISKERNINEKIEEGCDSMWSNLEHCWRQIDVISDGMNDIMQTWKIFWLSK